MRWDPWEAAAARGLMIAFYPKHRGGPIQAAYFPDLKLIAMQAGLTEEMSRSLLTEELSHHDLGHQPSPDPVETARQEVRARKHAARRLIDLDRLASAATRCGTLHEIAGEVGAAAYLVQVRLLDLQPAELRQHGEWTT